MDVGYMIPLAQAIQDKVKVKFKVSISGLDYSYAAGTQMLLPAEKARVFIACGHAVSIDQDINYRLWAPVNAGLDWSSEITLLKAGISCQLVKTRPEDYLALDIKSGKNIHSFDKFKDEIIEKDILKEFNLDAIREIRYAARSAAAN